MNVKDLHLLDTVATGPFSVVYKAYWKDEQVAVKEVKVPAGLFI